MEIYLVDPVLYGQLFIYYSIWLFLNLKFYLKFNFATRMIHEHIHFYLPDISLEFFAWLNPFCDVTITIHLCNVWYLYSMIDNAFSNKYLLV